MLTTFVPASGPYSGQTYNLPLLNGNPVVSPQFGQVMKAPSRGVGHYNTAGTAPAFLKGCALSANFIITPNWLKLKGYNPTTDGLETALNDFADYVMAGGTGTLTDVPPTGTKVNTGGATLTSRTTKAYVSGNPQITRRDGGAAAEIQVTFMSPSGQWTNSDGSLQYMV